MWPHRYLIYTLRVISGLIAWKTNIIEDISIYTSRVVIHCDAVYILNWYTFYNQRNRLNSGCLLYQVQRRTGLM